MYLAWKIQVHVFDSQQTRGIRNASISLLQDNAWSSQQEQTYQHNLLLISESLRKESQLTASLNSHENKGDDLQAQQSIPPPLTSGL